MLFKRSQNAADAKNLFIAKNNSAGVSEKNDSQNKPGLQLKTSGLAQTGGADHQRKQSMTERPSSSKQKGKESQDGKSQNTESGGNPLKNSSVSKGTSSNNALTNKAIGNGANSSGKKQGQFSENTSDSLKGKQT